MDIKNIVNKLKNEYKVKDVQIAIVAGSGLMNSLPTLSNVIEVEYSALGIPASKVKGHSGKFVFGTINGKNVVCFSRIHYYEHGDMSLVRLPLEVVSALGASMVVLMTSSGGINSSYKIGDVVLICDHLNMTGQNPLIAINNLQFTNMGNCYSRECREQVLNIAKQKGIRLQQGVHAQMSGPSYETIAEINMLKKLGADTVSMSTAYDTIIANYLNLKVLGFAVVVNTFSGGDDKLTHQEVLDNAQKASANIKQILTELI